MIQAGIKEIYFEIAYDSPNKDFDAFWRQIMETHQGLRVFEQISISDQAKQFMMDVLMGDSTRKIASTDTLTFSGFKKFILDVVSAARSRGIVNTRRKMEKTITEDDHLFTIERCNVCGKNYLGKINNPDAAQEKRVGLRGTCDEN